MEQLEKDTLMNLMGGATISGTMINAITNAIKTLLEVGKGFGSAIRRMTCNQMCPLK